MKKRQRDKRKNTAAGAADVCPPGQVRDVNSRAIFKDPVLCAQFLRDYTDIPLLQDVQPEDIEDVTEKYHAYLGITFESDTVKKICLQAAGDIHTLRQDTEPDKIDEILKDTPEYILDIIASVMWGLLMKLNVPAEEAGQYVEMIKERQMGYLFENMEKLDIQKERRKTEEERKKAEEERRKAEEQRERAKEAEKKLEDSKEHEIAVIISLCQKFRTTRDAAIVQLVENISMSRAEAEEKLNLYWKEETM